MVENQPAAFHGENRDIAMRSRFIIDLLADAMPGFGIAYYGYSYSSSSLSLNQTAGEEVEFASTISTETGKTKDFVKNATVCFFTPGADDDVVSQFFASDANIEDGATLLLIPVSDVGEMTEVLIIFAHQFGDFQDYHRSLVESFDNA